MRSAPIHDSRFTIRAPRARHAARGVTLVELIVVIAITGIIAASVAVFIRRPVEGYVDATRRAALSETADTALRRITRDLRSALPNSIRVDGTGRFIEYLQTSGGGRYRVEARSDGLGNPLDFAAPDGQFDVIGPMPDFSGPGTRHIVVYNLNSAPALPTANAYVGDNREAYSGDDGTTITLNAPKQFPFASPGRRFQVVQYPVTYACDPLPGGTGELRRHWGYTIQAAQPTATLPLDGNSTLLATNVTDCGFSYVISGATQRTGVVALNLQVGQAGETVRMFQQVHVSNVP